MPTIPTKIQNKSAVLFLEYDFNINWFPMWQLEHWVPVICKIAELADKKKNQNTKTIKRTKAHATTIQNNNKMITKSFRIHA